MTDCVFCKIINGKIPCTKIYENDKVLAFLDVSPISKGHTLVIPKKHFESLKDIPEDILCDLTKTAKKLAPLIIKAVNAHAFNLGLNNGKEAGQLVMHVHFHIIPRFENDGHKHWSEKSYKESEMQKVAGKIQKEIK